MENLIYVPVLRGRQEEFKILKKFNFGNFIFPFLEIVKAYDRARPNQKSFQEIYGKIIKAIKAPHVFVDLPLYLNNRTSTKPETVEFTLTVIASWENRTKYLLSLSELSDKIIPVISSYRRFQDRSHLQEQTARLREKYDRICFRITHSDFLNDWEEIKELTSVNDYIFLDMGQSFSQPNGPAMREITESLIQFQTCPKIISRSAISNDIQNKDLQQDQVIVSADNGLLENFRDYGADSFSDYAGIKRDMLTSGGSISPGFVYFDAVKNQYFGYKYQFQRDLNAFRTDIVPAVLRSNASSRMSNSSTDFLNNDNLGWLILNRIYDDIESGKSQAKFKFISMFHYLHCIKKMIEDDII